MKRLNRQVVDYAVFLGITALLLCIGIYSCTPAAFPDSPDKSNEIPDSGSNDGNDNGSISDDEIDRLVRQNVTAKATYSDYIWHFHIESQLHNALPDYTVYFAIGHGDIDGETLCSIGDDAYEYRVSTSGDKVIVDFENPVWFYYIFGEGSLDFDSEEIWTMCEMYYNTYTALKEKGLGNLSSDEKQLYRAACSYLDDAERDADAFYPSIQVYIPERSHFYMVGEYER